jgi:hypothetical protein
MAGFGTIVVSKQQAVFAAKSYQAYINEIRVGNDDRAIAARVVRACEQHRMDAVDLPMNSPLIDFIVPEVDGVLVKGGR